MEMEDMTPRVAGLLKRRLSPPLVPATFFGMVLGLGGLGNGWRAAARVWNVPDLVGEVLSLSAAAVWLAWLVLYGLKWITSREEALAEFRHPIQAFFIALVPVATLIAGIAVAPYLPTAAWVMFVLGVASQVLFSAWAMGELWQGGRHTEATTPDPVHAHRRRMLRQHHCLRRVRISGNRA